ncbi:MAG: NERD domain-containing protein, partial [Thermoplasmata archaeon]|nr:NERD domain-containing protein [Thermoplasmata archaeon]
RRQMDEIIRALNAAFAPVEEVVRLIIGIERDMENGVSRQIDGLLVTENRLLILEIKSISCGTLMINFDPELRSLAEVSRNRRGYIQRQKKWLIDGAVSEGMWENPIDQVEAQRRNLIWLVLQKIRNKVQGSAEADQRQRMGRSRYSRREKEDDPAYRLGSAIGGFIVIDKGEIAYGTPEAESYVRSQRWLIILQMDALIDRIRFEDVARYDEGPILREDEFSKLVEIVGAEKRPYHRWLTKPLEHEYTEISRVPYLDFLFESEDSNNLIRAMDGAYQFRLRAYSKDIVDVYYRVGNEQVKMKALTILADWDISSLGDLLVSALKKRGFPSLRVTAIKHLQAENVFSETLPSLEKVLKNSYESEEDKYLALAVMDAIGNLQSQEAGKVVFDFMDRLVGDNFYSGMIILAENDDRERQTDFELKFFSKALEKIAMCRYTNATGLVQQLLIEFPLVQYVSYSEMMSDSKNRENLLKIMRTHSALDTVLRSLVAFVGDIWDGREETEIIKIADELYQETLHEGDKGFGYHSLYDSYLKVVSKIGGAEGLSLLMRHYDSLSLDETVSEEERLRLGDWIIEAIGDMGHQKGYDFLAEKLQEYKHDPQLYEGPIVTILESLGNSGDPRYVEAISTLLELDETKMEVGFPQYIKHYATRALARIGGDQSFSVLMQVFLKQPALASDALREILNSSDPLTRDKLARRAEKLLLQKFKKETLMPGSRESDILTEVVSEESLPFLFELTRKPEWYHRPLPQQIAKFSHIDWVQNELLGMLESSDEHQRSFAIDVIVGSGCLGEDTDEVLSRFRSDPSGLVRCSMIDYYTFVKKDCLEVASFLSDTDMKVRAHASHGLQMIPHRGGQLCLVISDVGWQGVQRMIYNERGIFFLEITKEDFFHPEAVEELESHEPFYLAANEIGCIFVHHSKLKTGESGKVDVLGLYLEKKEQDGLRLLVLPLPEDHDEIGVRDWKYYDVGLSTVVSMYRNKQTEDESDSEKADELFRLADERYIMRSEGPSDRTNGTP